MSFSRPDPSSPASIADAGFSTSRRGFDQTEVRDFLRMIAAELGRLQERERFLERELRTAQTNPDLASVTLDDAALTRLLGEETARVLTTARESAAEIRQKAEEAAAQLVNEAADEAARLREEAEIEASRRRSDAAADAEAELAMAKQQGREMVNEARAYRERVLSELARRRELAREQIEQLLHGRDRLMQSFERARLVAVDVVAELQPLGEPDEYVNLAPTTGPVPVMVPNSPRPGAPFDQAASPPVSVDQPDVADEEEDIVEAPEAGDAAGSDVVVEADEATAEDDADTGPDAADEDVEVGFAEVTGTDAAAMVDVEPDDGHDLEDDRADDAVSEVAGQPDDVVVDLFSRLRAESVSAVEDTAAGPADASGDVVEVIDPDAVDHTDETDEDAGATDEDAEPSPFERRDADLTPIIVAAAKKLKRVLADEQNEVLETLRGKEPIRSIDALLPSADEHAGRYQTAIADELRLAAEAGSSLVGGSDAGLGADDVAAATGVADDVLAEWLIVPMRDRLERCVADGDGDNAGIGKRVRAVYREWKTQHIDEQLDDVIRMAHGRGLLAAIEPGTPVAWVCDATRQVCADCDDNTLAGVVAAGEVFPTGHTFAPAHMGCRCLLLPDGR